MSVTATYNSQITVVETLAGPLLGADNTVTTDGLNQTAGLTSSSTPPVTKASEFEKTLSSGTGTIDLTALPDSNGVPSAVSFDGLKIAVAKLKNKSTNANAITIAKGASNGHTGFGASFSLTLQPGDEILVKCNANSGNVAVSPTNKTFDVTGTGSQVLQCIFVAG